MNCYDIIVKGGNILTPEPVKEGYVDSIGIKAGKIASLGLIHDIRSKVCLKTKIINAEGTTIIPAFIDAHTHMVDMGFRMGWIDLSGVNKFMDMMTLLSEVASKTPKGQWIIGHSWDESKWKDEPRYPTLKDLDEISRDHPIYLRRIDGHMGVINSLAYEKLKIPHDLPYLVFDEKGKFTGLIKEKAMEYVDAKLKSNQRELIKAVERSHRVAINKGVTAVGEFVTPESLNALNQYFAKNFNMYKVTAYFWVEYLDYVLKMGIRTFTRTSKIKIGGVKLMVDGSIGSRTAALREPYKDDPSNKGKLLFTEEELEEIILKAEKADMQVVIHAIGDRAIDTVIDVYKKARKVRELRHRIEHFEMVHEEHIMAVKKLGIVVSMQPNFTANWQQRGGLYERRLGWERAKKMNPYKQIYESGVIMAFGSDNMPFDPLYGIYGAMSHPLVEERLTFEEAVKAYTYYSAVANNSEKYRGSISPGKEADIVMLEGNLVRTLPEDVLNTKIRYFLQDGRLLRSL